MTHQRGLFMTVLVWLTLIAVVPALHAQDTADSGQADEPASEADGGAERTLSPGLGPAHALAMHGAPALGPDFSHFPHANPNAPKGGRLVRSDVATFDSLNPFIPFGRPMWHMRFFRRVFEPLMIRGDDEPFTVYGLLAQTVEVPEDRSWIAFTLREGIRFSDGTPLTLDDVVFSVETLKTHGRPHFRRWFGQIERIDRLDRRTIRFVFAEDTQNRELPLLIAMTPIFSKAYYASRAFERTTLEPPIGSGPYLVGDVQPGRSLSFVRNPDYWGADLPVNRGFNNFDEVVHEYFRDANAAFEAFKAGAVTLRMEPDSNGLRWARGYGFPAMDRGDVVRAEIRPAKFRGMFGFAINTRRPPFDDIRLREALVLAFDFQWINRTYFFGAYERSTSFYPGTPLAADGPATQAERALLAPFPGRVTDEILNKGLKLAVEGDYYARTRARLKKALTLLGEAGYEERGGWMHAPDGTRLAFEVMIEHPDHQRVALAYAQELEKIGIDLRVRLVDSSQFQTRARAYDFDLMPFLWPSTLSPGNEQRFRWGSAAGRNPGSYNYPGVDDPAVDAMIDALVGARDYDGLIAAGRALDRILLSGHYVVPLFDLPVDRLAWWRPIRKPERTPLRGYDLDAWWWGQE